MTLKEIAEKISAHLARWERDPKVNPRDPYTTMKPGMVHLYSSGAFPAGNRVAIRYVSYQHLSKLKKADAEAYLAWIDAGNIGRHYEWRRR